MKYIAQIILEREIEASDADDAVKKANRWQLNMAGSNDGSELIANADVKVVERK